MFCVPHCTSKRKQDFFPNMDSGGLPRWSDVYCKQVPGSEEGADANTHLVFPLRAQADAAL